MGAALARPGPPREIVALLIVAVTASLLVGLHMWWARYGPQLWWLPILAVAAGLSVPARRAMCRAAWALAALLLVDAVAVEARHFAWERQATRTTYAQLAFLRQQREIEVDLQYFREPYAQRLRVAGVTFRPSQTLHCANPMQLMSVPHGYPGQVRACISANVP